MTAEVEILEIGGDYLLGRLWPGQTLLHLPGQRRRRHDRQSRKAQNDLLHAGRVTEPGGCTCNGPELTRPRAESALQGQAREDQRGKNQGEWRQHAPHQRMQRRDVAARQDQGQGRDVGLFPDDDAVAQPVQPCPAGEVQQRVVKGVVREDVFQIVALGIHKELPQGS